MNVLSLFDGMSCGQLALERANVSVDNYYACEIDKYAMQIANKNFPNTIQLGDVTTANYYFDKDIDYFFVAHHVRDFLLQENSWHLMIHVLSYSLSL